MPAKRIRTSWVISILIFCIAFLFLGAKEHSGWEIALMFFIGGLLFHTVWEGKSQYTYPYIFTLIPLASYAVVALGDKVGSLFKLKERKGNNGKK